MIRLQPQCSFSSVAAANCQQSHAQRRQCAAPHSRPRRRKGHSHALYLLPRQRCAVIKRQLSTLRGVAACHLSGNVISSRPCYQYAAQVGVNLRRHIAGILRYRVGNRKFLPSRVRRHAVYRLHPAPYGVFLPREKAIVGKGQLRRGHVARVAQRFIQPPRLCQRPSCPDNGVALCLRVVRRPRHCLFRHRGLKSVNCQRWRCPAYKNRGRLLCNAFCAAPPLCNQQLIGAAVPNARCRQPTLGYGVLEKDHVPRSVSSVKGAAVCPFPRVIQCGTLRRVGQNLYLERRHGVLPVHLPADRQILICVHGAVAQRSQR